MKYQTSPFVIACLLSSAKAVNKNYNDYCPTDSIQLPSMNIEFPSFNSCPTERMNSNKRNRSGNRSNRNDRSGNRR